MSFLDYIRVLWPIASVLTPVLIATCALWLQSKFLLKAEAAGEKTRVNQALHDISEEIDDHASRLKLLEQDGRQPPSRHALNNEVTKLIARQGGVESAVHALETQLATANGYLRTLIERGLHP